MNPPPWFKTQDPERIRWMIQQGRLPYDHAQPAIDWLVEIARAEQEAARSEPEMQAQAWAVERRSDRRLAKWTLAGAWITVLLAALTLAATVWPLLARR